MQWKSLGRRKSVTDAAKLIAGSECELLFLYWMRNCVHLYIEIGQFSSNLQASITFWRWLICMRNFGNRTNWFWKPGPICTGLCAGQCYVSVFLGLDQINKHNLSSQSGICKWSVPSEVTVTGHFPRSFPRISLCSSQDFWILALHWKHEEKHKLSFMPLHHCFTSNLSQNILVLSSREAIPSFHGWCYF